MNDRIANDLIRYAELVEDGALISPEEMNCASLMRIAAEALAQPAVAEQHKQEPVGVMVSMDVSKGDEPEYRIFGRIYEVQRDGEGEDEVTYLAIEDSRNFDTTSPPVTESHKRKPLTDEEIFEINNGLATWMFPVETRVTDRELAFARAIEAAHGIRPSDFKE